MTVGQGHAKEAVAAGAAPSPGGSWLVEHWGLVVSLGGGGLVLVAVLGRAKFDPTTALGIIESLGPVDVWSGGS